MSRKTRHVAATVTCLILLSACSSTDDPQPPRSQAVDNPVIEPPTVERSVPTDLRIRAPWELVQAHREAGNTVDPEPLELVHHLYPNTGLGGPGAVEPLVFVRVREIGKVPAQGKCLHVISVVRARWNMLAPRGQSEVVLIDESGQVFERQTMTADATLDGTVIRFGDLAVGIDLSSAAEVEAWRSHEPSLLEAHLSVGRWYERVLGGLENLSGPELESRLASALNREWNSRPVSIRIRSEGGEILPAMISELASRFRGGHCYVHPPTLSDIDWGPTGIPEFDAMEDPWSGRVRAVIVAADGREWEATFSVAGAKPGS